MRLLFSLLLCASASTLHPCECRSLVTVDWDQSIVRHYMNTSDVIFIGELAGLEEGHYFLKVLHVFKGDLHSGQVVRGDELTSCSGWPNGNSKSAWIYYGNYAVSGGIMRMDYTQCGPTRNLSEPRFYTHEKNNEYWKLELAMLNNLFNTDIDFPLDHK